MSSSNSQQTSILIFPEGGGPAIINALFKSMSEYTNCKVMWETEATKPLTNEQGEIRGAKVRKSDGRLYNVLGQNVMLACGGFEGFRKMSTKHIGPRTQTYLSLAQS